jgi:molybdenum cofactor cytidylyltransferase
MSIAAVVLAAGSSSRLGEPKQLLEFDGEPLLKRVSRVALAAGCDPVLVVLGAQAELCRTAIAELPVQVLENDEWQTGLASSIRCGISAVPESAAAAMLLTCDQPHVSATLLRELIAASSGGRTIAASRYAETLGIPALFPRSSFCDLLALMGDAGAKRLLLKDVGAVASVLFPEGALDIDRPADVAAAEQRSRFFR